MESIPKAKIMVPDGVRVAVCQARIGAGREVEERDARVQCQIASAADIVELEEVLVEVELGSTVRVVWFVEGERIQLSPSMSPSASIPPCTSI